MTQQNPKSKKIAIITNSGNGPGRLIAHKLASQGIIVVVNDDDTEAALKTVEEIIINGDDALFTKEQINKPNEIKIMMNKVFQKYGSIDIFINNLCFGKNIPINQTLLGHVREILEANIRSSFLCNQYALKYMREKKDGKIINTLFPPTQFPNSENLFHSLKGLINGLTKDLFMEEEIHNIQVNSIIGIFNRSRTNSSSKNHFQERDLKEKKVLGTEKYNSILMLILLLTNDSDNSINGNIFEIQ